VKKRKTITLMVVAAAVMVAISIACIRNKRIPFSRLHTILDYGVQDVGAIMFVIYDVDYERDAEWVKDVKPRLIIGDKRLVKRHFDIIPKVPVIENCKYVEKIFNALPDVKGHEGPEHMIGSLYDAGIIFFTKDGKIYLFELIDHSNDLEGGMIWVAKVPAPELVPVFTEFFDDAWSLLQKRVLLTKPVIHMEKSKLKRLIDKFEDVDSVAKD